jgi:hypothetical protein
MKKPLLVQPLADGNEWRDLRDARGKLCARLDVKRMVLEIKRSDRNIVAQFDLHDFLVDLSSHQKDDE